MSLIKIIKNYISGNSFYKIIKNFFNYSSYIIFFNRNKYYKIKNNIKNKTIIWHVCTPKSGSTFYMTYLISNLDDYKKISVLPYWKDRHQEMSPDILFNEIRKYPLSKKFFTERHHSRFNDHIKKYLSKEHKVIIQTRNIYKTILSLKDFIDEKLDYAPWFYLKKKLWNTYSDQQKINYLIINYTPWHITFLMSWYYAETVCKKYFINYEDVVSQTKETTEKILDKKIKDNKFLINKEEVFYKVGLDRKNSLSQEQIQKIDQIIEQNLCEQSLNAKKDIYKLLN